MTDSNATDFNLVSQVVERIPTCAWPDVRVAIITNLVDSMPSDVLKRLTNDPEGFDKAEEILTAYYQDDHRNSNLIEDAFRILGDDTTLYLLDSLQLDKLPQP
jgi:hypothetical protein